MARSYEKSTLIDRLHEYDAASKKLTEALDKQNYYFAETCASGQFSKIPEVLERLSNLEISLDRINSKLYETKAHIERDKRKNRRPENCAEYDKNGGDCTCSFPDTCKNCDCYEVLEHD